MNSNSSEPLRHDAMLESVLPGYTFLSRFLLTHFKIDLNHYGFCLLIILCSRMALRYVVDLFVSPLGAASTYLHDSFTCTVEVQGQDKIFKYLLYWLMNHRSMARTKHFKASNKLFIRGGWCHISSSLDPDDDDKEPEYQPGDNFDEWWSKVIARRRDSPLHYIPSAQIHRIAYTSPWLFWQFWRWIKFQRITSTESYTQDRIIISCWGLPFCNRGLGMLKQLLTEAQRAWIEKKKDKIEIWTAGAEHNHSASMTWVQSEPRAPRPLDTVVLDSKAKSDIMADIEKFLTNRSVYAVRGVPYRRGYLLYGPPGTGKTSLCVAIAGHLKLPIFVLDPSSPYLYESTLKTLFRELPERCIVLMEDVDCAQITQSRASGNDSDGSDDSDDNDDSETHKKNKDDKEDQKRKRVRRHPWLNGISLSVLLNTIDGVDSQEGRILMMTSNHAEKLDAALVRPGRVDLHIEFKYAAREQIQSFFKAFYLPLHTLSHVVQVKNDERVPVVTPGDLDKLAYDFAEQLPHRQLTVAELQGHLLEFRDDPEAAVNNVEKLLRKTQKERRKRMKRQMAQEEKLLAKERQSLVEEKRKYNFRPRRLNAWDYDY